MCHSPAGQAVPDLNYCTGPKWDEGEIRQFRHAKDRDRVYHASHVPATCPPSNLQNATPSPRVDLSHMRVPRA